MKIGCKIRELRTSQKISQNTLGKKAGIPQTTISDWEKGKSIPNVEEALRLAKALEVSIVDLIEE